MEQHIRFLGEEDLPQIMAIEEACFTHPWSEEAYRSDLTQNPVAYYLGIFEGETLLAYGGLWLVLEAGHITNVAVSPARRQEGLGRRLMLALGAWAKSQGCQTLDLEVRSSNQPALALYRALGFQEDGLRKNYYTQPQEDAVLMSWQLNEKPPG